MEPAQGAVSVKKRPFVISLQFSIFLTKTTLFSDVLHNENYSLFYD